MIILINPQAGGGTALDRWRRISAILPPTREKIEIHYLGPQLNIDEVVKTAVARGDHHVLAAGGDGTVNAALGALMRLPSSAREEVVLGAIGLGSSNDFHKPLGAAHMIEGVPVRMDFRHPDWRDVGSVLVNRNGQTSIHYFLINASAGVTAEGNALFNSPDVLLAWLKRRSTPAAILYAALRALAQHENQPCTMEICGYSPRNLKLTNLGIVKNPHFSGSLHYEVPASYADGSFQIFLAEDMHLIERAALLHALSRGKFRGRGKTSSWQAPGLTLASSTPFRLELDGETLQADRAVFTILQKTLQVCS